MARACQSPPSRLAAETGLEKVRQVGPVSNSAIAQWIIPSAFMSVTTGLFFFLVYFCESCGENVLLC